MKTSVTRTFRFEAAHQLPWHQGKCRDLHGHSYRLDVTVEGPLNEHGIVIDFADIAAAVNRDVITRLDHCYLNDVVDNPTAELLAQHIWKTLDSPALPISRIRLWETIDCYADVSR